MFSRMPAVSIVCDRFAFAYAKHFLQQKVAGPFRSRVLQLGPLDWRTIREGRRAGDWRYCHFACGFQYGTYRVISERNPKSQPFLSGHTWQPRRTVSRSRATLNGKKVHRDIYSRECKRKCSRRANVHLRFLEVF